MTEHVVLALIALTVFALVLFTVAAFVYVPSALSEEEEEESEPGGPVA